LLEQLAEPLVEPRNLRERLEVARGRVRAPSLDPRAQPFRQTRAALVPLACEIDGDLRLHDDRVPFPRLLDAARQLDFFHPSADPLDELGEGLRRVGVDTIPVRRL